MNLALNVGAAISLLLVGWFHPVSPFLAIPILLIAGMIIGRVAAKADEFERSRGGAA